MKRIFKQFLRLMLLASICTPFGQLRALSVHELDEFNRTLNLASQKDDSCSECHIEQIKEQAYFYANASDTFCRILGRISRYLAYWQNAQHHPYKYALSRLPNQWLTEPSYQQEIDTHIAALEQLQHKIATLRGTLQEPIDELLVSHASRTLHAPDQDANIFICQLLGNDTTQDTCTEQLLAQFEEQTIERIDAHRPAHHFSRHWLAYSAGVACVAGCAYTYLNDPQGWQDVAHEHTTQMQQGMAQFWDDHFDKPTRAIYNHFFGKPASTNINIIPHDVADKTLHESYNTVIIGLRDVALAVADDTKTYIALTSSKLDTLNLEEKSALIGTMFNNLAESATWKNAYNVTKCAKVVSAKLQEGLFDLNDLKILIKEVAEENRVNRYLIQMVAAGLLGWLSVKSIRATYNSIWSKRIVHKNIIAALNKFEHRCNRYDNGAIVVDDAGRGMLAFRIYQLKKAAAKSLSNNTYIAFMHHVRELENPTYNCRQKLRVVDIMRRQYDFLQI